jgi:hypothetical protein
MQPVLAVCAWDGFVSAVDRCLLAEEIYMRQPGPCYYALENEILASQTSSLLLVHHEAKMIDCVTSSSRSVATLKVRCTSVDEKSQLPAQLSYGIAKRLFCVAIGRTFVTTYWSSVSDPAAIKASVSPPARPRLSSSMN